LNSGGTLTSTDLRVARTGTGTLNLYSGSTLNIDGASGSALQMTGTNGTVNQYAGNAVNVGSASFYGILKIFATTSGVYNMYGGAINGTANASSSIVLGGNTSTSGTFNQSGGAVSIPKLTVGDSVTLSSATYNLSGGSLTVTTQLIVATYGNGYLNQTGGTLVMTGGTNGIGIGTNAGVGGITPSGIYEISGGSLTAAKMTVGNAAAGTTGTFRVKGSAATISIQNTTSTNDTIYSQTAGDVLEFQINAPTVSKIAVEPGIGGSGRKTATISAGGLLKLGFFNGYVPTSQVTYTLMDAGTITAGSFANITQDPSNGSNWTLSLDTGVANHNLVKATYVGTLAPNTARTLANASDGYGNSTGTINFNTAKETGVSQAANNVSGLVGHVEVTGYTSGSAYVLLDINGTGDTQTQRDLVVSKLTGAAGGQFAADHVSDDTTAFGGVLANFVGAAGTDYDVALKFDTLAAASNFSFSYDLSGISGVSSLNNVAITPVPEPAGVAVIGLAGLALRRRRRRAKLA
jgi:MYXO-CTERM domain-containing protein